MDITTERVECDGVGLQVTKAGEGPLVLLLHGFPELAYSWRHQIPALAEAGYTVVAPDMRGYGASDCPPEITDYDITQLTGDVTNLIGHYGNGEPAVVVGHDWGAMVAWAHAVFRPDLVRGVIGVSVPYLPSIEMSIRDMAQASAGEDGFHYMVYFQEPGVAEAELEADPIDTMRRLLWLGSGDGARLGAQLLTSTEVPTETKPKQERFLEHPAPDGLPPWLSEGDVEAFGRAFMKSGFRGGLNWYRNLHRNWELMRPWRHAPVTVPSGFIGGSLDMVLTGTGDLEGEHPMLAMQQAYCRDLRQVNLIDGAGHWTQQEAPEETNAAILSFLAGLT